RAAARGSPPARIASSRATVTRLLGARPALAVGRRVGGAAADAVEQHLRAALAEAGDECDRRVEVDRVRRVLQELDQAALEREVEREREQCADPRPEPAEEPDRLSAYLEVDAETVLLRHPRHHAEDRA